MLPFSQKPHSKFSFFIFSFCVCQLVVLNSGFELDESLTYIWPLPSEFKSGNETLTVDPTLSLSVLGKGGDLKILREGFERYKKIIFKHVSGVSIFEKWIGIRSVYDISELRIIVNSDSEELQLGVDESYTLSVAKNDGKSIVGEATIEANTVYGALRGLETFSQLCAFDYGTKSVQVYKAPWYIQDKPRFAYRGLLLDTSRHYLPIDVIKQIIESMSYAKLNVLHWHIIDEQSFPLEVPTYPDLWKGSYTKWERYTVEDASEISKGWTPVNWEETFNAFASNLNPQTVVHNWLGPGVCPKAVAKGFRCIFSNQGVWYLDHLDVPWDQVYNAEPLEGINNVSEQNLVLGGEVCMWCEMADTSNVQQTIWPRAAAAAERLWSKREPVSARNITLTALPRYQYFRCLLNRRGVQAAPATNKYARSPPNGPGSCYEQ
ncbi:Beta-hexosaminidase 1 isoform 3 [Theobroma cacao]|uniref:beta-N-acetylhexosaminidase n=1 Tax=Theobroma cacao TaxID=3641 RepID=A0A061FU99_THECC|nr:Beta-hexosaminidase 1 isoform 3 [Theobroma cacao]